MRAQVVEHDDITAVESWRQHLLDVRQEPLPIDRPIEHHRCGQPIMTKGSDEGRGLPAGKRDLANQPLAAPRAAVQAAHVVLGPSLVDEHQAGRVERRLKLAPAGSSFSDIRPILLGGVQCFFYRSASRGRRTATPCHSPRQGPAVRPTRAASLQE